MKPNPSTRRILPQTSSQTPPRILPHITRRLLALGCLLIFAALGGCATPTQKAPPEPDTIVGKPPAAEDDPFFLKGAPTEAQRVAPSGQIGPEQGAEPDSKEPATKEVAVDKAPSKETGVDKTPSKEAAVDEARPKQTTVDKTPPKQAVVEKQTPAEPLTPEQLQPTPPTAEQPDKSASTQCFSCVKICPLDDGCAQTNEDVICGWSTQQPAAQAKKLARAQCDGALDLARQAPVWSRIDGECPPATCR